MRPAYRVLRAVAALGVATVLLVPAFTGPASAEDQTVLVGEGNENRFSPATVRIKPGDTVTWQYAGGLNHTVTSTTANWSKNSPVGPPTTIAFETSYLFEKAGTYRYICSTHEDVGMKGTVIVEGVTVKPSPKPTRTSTTRPTPSPSRTAAPSTAPGSATPSPTPSASAGSATPVIPSGSVAPPSATTRPPRPVVAPTVNNTYLGEGGLTEQPATGRGKGLPVMLALLLIGGVGSAELRALLASGPE